MDTKTFLQMLESNVQLKKDNATLSKIASTSLTISSTLAKNNNILKILIRELLETPCIPTDLRIKCENILNK